MLGGRHSKYRTTKEFGERLLGLLAEQTAVIKDDSRDRQHPETLQCFDSATCWLLPHWLVPDTISFSVLPRITIYGSGEPNQSRNASSTVGMLLSYATLLT
jgi:hypothetical protein